MKPFPPLAAALVFILAILPTVRAQTARVQISIIDGRTGQRTAARVHLKDSQGKPQRAGELPFWRDHFVCDGAVELNLSPGSYTYEIERGPEFLRAEGSIDATTTTNVTVKLQRLVDLAREGWWSGETHVHRELASAELLMRAEDLHVAQFITWWNKVNPWTNAVPPKPALVKFDGNRFYQKLGGEDERDGGALLYFDLEQPLEITDGTRHYPSSLVFARQARQRRDTIWIDIEKPFWWDFPLWIAHGCANTVGIAHNHMHRGGGLDSEAWGKPRDHDKFPGPQGNGRWTQQIYYHLLNCGVRIPPSAGSASGVLPNPVGYDRVYVQCDGELTYEKWRDGLFAGRSFVSNGPLLRCRANGQFPGHVFKTADPLPLRLEMQLDSADPIAGVELVHNGRIETVTMPRVMTIEESGWFLLRAIAGVTNTFRFASTAPWYVEIGGRPAPVHKASAQFFVDWCRERTATLEKLSQISPSQKPELLQPWQEAEKFWTDKLYEH